MQIVKCNIIMHSQIDTVKWMLVVNCILQHIHLLLARVKRCDDLIFENHEQKYFVRDGSWFNSSLKDCKTIYQVLLQHMMWKQCLFEVILTSNEGFQVGAWFCRAMTPALCFIIKQAVSWKTFLVFPGQHLYLYQLSDNLTTKSYPFQPFYLYWQYNHSFTCRPTAWQ